MSDKQSLIVPVQVHAMCVGVDESVQKSSFFSPPTAEYSRDIKDMLKGDYINGPFVTDSRTRDELQGVHLHWFLPDALTQVLDAADKDSVIPSVFPRVWFPEPVPSPESDSTDINNNPSHVFPVVPNRWLVTRIHVNNTTSAAADCDSKSWLIESDYVTTDYDPDGTSIPWMKDDISYRYLGRASLLEDWQGEDTQAERFQRLTAIGHGDPSFSLYYPNCRNVFGFHDSLKDLNNYSPAESQLSYIVIGWYSDKHEDPLALARKAGKMTELLEYFNWSVEQDAEVEKINQSIYCGMIRDLQWDPEKEYIHREFEDNQALSVGIGNRVSDGLSALLAGITDSENKETNDQILNAFQAGYFACQDKVDAMAELRKSLHKNTFTPEGGGVLWSIKARDPNNNEALNTLDSSMAMELDALNSKQAQFNSRFFDLESRKQQTFLDWYKYMYFKYDPDTRKFLKKKNHINGKKFRKFLEPEMAFEKNMAELHNEIETLAHALDEHIGTDYVLIQDQGDARFFRPDDPVILLAGDALKPTLQHTPEQLLPCLQEDHLQGSNTLLLSSHATNLLQQGNLPQCTNRLLNELFFLNQEPLPEAESYVSVRDGFCKVLTQSTGNPPWNPIFMHWNISYQPIEKMLHRKKSENFSNNVITSRLTLSEQNIDLCEQQSGGQNEEPTPYQGISILTPNAVQNFAQLAQTYLDGSSEKGVIWNALNKLQETPVLSQALSGFHDALIMRSGELLFPVNNSKADPSEKEFLQTIRTYVGDFDQYAPNPKKDFNPVRGGWMKIDKLRIVDTFGQYRDLKLNPDKVYVSQNLNADKDNSTRFYLAPRLVQPSRLLLRWLSAEKAAEKKLMAAHEHPASTPICGWMLPNFLGRSLMIYNSHGIPLGEIRLQENGSTSFRSSPGRSPEFNIHFVSKADLKKQIQDAIPENAYLRNFVASMLRHDTDYMKAFMQILDDGLSDVEPEGVQDFHLRALLIGRPVAIVRVSLKLDLKGLPAVNQSWNSLVKDMLNPDNKSSRECANFTQIKFPLRLGNSKANNEYNDGLLGYFRQKKNNKDYDYNTFYSYQFAEQSNEHIVNPAESIIELTADKNTDPMTFLILMDPRGKLNVTSGILPKKSIELPPVHYEMFYNSLEVSFLTTPVLHHMPVSSEEGEAGIDLPVSAEDDHNWRWIGKDQTTWHEKTVLFKTTKALSDSPVMISEGWLKMVKN